MMASSHPPHPRNKILYVVVISDKACPLSTSDTDTVIWVKLLFMHRIQGSLDPRYQGSLDSSIQGSSVHRIQGSSSPRIQGSFYPWILGSSHPQMIFHFLSVTGTSHALSIL